EGQRFVVVARHVHDDAAEYVALGIADRPFGVEHAAIFGTDGEALAEDAVLPRAVAALPQLKGVAKHVLRQVEGKPADQGAVGSVELDVRDDARLFESRLAPHVVGRLAVRSGWRVDELLDARHRVDALLRTRQLRTELFGMIGRGWRVLGFDN